MINSIYTGHFLGALMRCVKPFFASLIHAPDKIGIWLLLRIIQLKRTRNLNKAERESLPDRYIHAYPFLNQQFWPHQRLQAPAYRFNGMSE